MYLIMPYICHLKIYKNKIRSFWYSSCNTYAQLQILITYVYKYNPLELTRPSAFTLPCYLPSTPLSISKSGKTRLQ